MRIWSCQLFKGIFFLSFLSISFFGLCWDFVAVQAFLQLQRAGAGHWLLLTAVASLVAEHGLQTLGLQWLQCVGFSSWGSRAELPCGMWNLPGSRIKPVAPALAGRFLITGPPGKPSRTFFSESYFFSCKSQFLEFSHSRSNSFISLRFWEIFFSLCIGLFSGTQINSSLSLPLIL